MLDGACHGLSIKRLYTAKNQDREGSASRVLLTICFRSVAIQHQRSNAWEAHSRSCNLSGIGLAMASLGMLQSQVVASRLHVGTGSREPALP